MSQSVSERWNCVLCTFENTNECWMCEMCGTQRPNNNWNSNDEMKIQPIMKDNIWCWQHHNDDYTPYPIDICHKIDILDVGDTFIYNTKYEIKKVSEDAAVQTDMKHNDIRLVLLQSNISNNKITNYQWFWQNKTSYEPFTDKQSEQLDKLNVGEVCSIYIRGNKYEIKKTSNDAGIQTNTFTNTLRNVVRKIKSNTNINKKNKVRKSIVVPVMLNVYQSKTAKLNVVFHSGVQVNGIEYSYGNGICINDVPDGWKYYKSIKICKNCKKSKEEINQILDNMKKTWKAVDYNLTKKNCNHFSNTFIKQLCGLNYAIPSWINKLANIGSTLENITGSTVQDIFGTFATSFNSLNSNIK